MARQTTDVERLCDAWGAVLTPTIDVLKALGKLPRDAPSARVWGLAEDSELTALADAPPFLGAAIDIGTTTIACALVDLATGCARSAASAWNLQAAFGGDIVSRIRFGMATPDGLDRLSQSARASIEEALRAACAHAGCDPAQVASACVVGNPTMVHLLLGVQPAGLAKAPHVGVTPGGMTLRAHQVGLPILPSAPVFFPPAIASNVGSDITAGLLAARMDARERVTALVDLGTNAEIVLGSSRGLFACSTAAGPAFEGATISRGMRAAPGAIDHVSWSREDGLQTHTIEGAAPQGFCGSGLLDLLAVLLDAGMIDTTGRLRPAAELGPEVPATLRACLVADGASTTFEIAGVKLTAGDVRRLQLAKGAVAAGIAALAARAGVTAAELDEVFLAGAFGSYIKAESARRIGLVPPQAGRIIALGNTAGQGARLALLCAQARRRAAELARTVTYVELAGDAAWRTTFAEAMLFPDR